MSNTRTARRLFISPLVVISLLLAACSSGEPASDSRSDTRVTSEKSELSVGGILRATTEKTTTEPADPRQVAPVPPRPQPRPQSGLLTAGDHDDLLNPDLYAEYAGRFLQQHGRGLPFVDPRSRVAIKVVDSAGRPFPFARIEVARAGNPLHLIAAADGSASFYPKFDGISAKTTIGVRSPAGGASRRVDLSGSRQLTITLPGAARPVSALDLVLVIDTTGSMGDEMTYLQTELDSIVSSLKREAGNVDLRIGIVLYRDEGDEYVVRSAPLTSDIESIRAMLANQEANGGGDMPEAVDQAVAAAERMQWRADAAKALLLVADAPPHAEGISPTLASTQRLRSKGVQIVPVAASGVEDSAQYVMRTMAVLTQGRYVFLTDDSGVGNPHEEPDVACYVVTRLDQLIARVLAGIVEGRRVEPAPGEVIRMVGNYDRGRCIKSGAAANQS